MGKTPTAIHLLLGTVSIFLTGCLNAPLPSDTASLSATFVVEEAVTSEGVEVILPGTTYRGFTNREGKIIFDNLPPRTYEILARTQGHEEYRESNVVLEPGDHIFLGQIHLTALPKDGKILGRVVLEDAEEATVEARLIGSNLVVSSATDGRFEFAGVPVGNYDVAFYHPGYVAEEPVSVTVEAGGTVSLGTITLRNTRSDKASLGALTGRVTFVGGHSVDGAEVFLPGTPHFTETKSDGTYWLDRVESGTHTLLFEKEGYLPFRMAEFEILPATVNRIPDVVLRQVPPYTSTANIQVATRGLEDAVDPNTPGIIAGVALYPDREDHSDILVRIVNPPTVVETDRDGRYLFSNVAPGIYTLRAESEGYLAAELVGVEVRPGDVTNAPRMDLAPSQPTADVPSGVRVVGQILLEDRGAQPGTSVSVEGTGDIALTDRGGWFRMEGVPPGDHVLLATREGYDSFAGTIQLSEGEETTLAAITLAPEVVYLEVIESSPGDGARKVEVSDRVRLQIRFNERLLARTANPAVRVYPSVETNVTVPEVDLLVVELMRRGRLPVQFNTDYVATVGAGLESVEGHHLEKQLSLRFTTGGPRILGSIPESGAGDVILLMNRPIIFLVNEGINLRELRQKITIRPDSGEVPNILRQRTPFGEKIEVQMLLRPNRNYTITIPSTVRTLKNDKYENTPYRVRFRTGSYDELPDATKQEMDFFDDQLGH